MKSGLVRWLPSAWAVVLTVLLLGPALGAGYVLSYDMVWVPHFALTREALGLGTPLPRAVPSDAVLAVLGYVLPQVVLQKLALAGGLVLAGVGAARLVGPRLAPRMAAVSLAIWSPLVAERLWIGHWPVLLGYAVVPWLVAAGRSARRSGRVPWSVWLLLPLGSLNANAGLVSAAVVLATGLGGSDKLNHRTLRRAVLLVVACAVANAPWIMAGLLHASQAQDASGYGLFALHGDALPAPLAALTLGGIWNRQVVPGARLDALAWVATVVFVGLAILGARRWGRRLGRRDVAAQSALWLAGYALAVLSWVAPGALAAAGEHIAGLGLFRDATRSLALCLPAFVGTVCAGVETIVCALPTRPQRLAVGTAAALLPLMVLPDAAWGVGGALAPVAYPSEWAQARAAIASTGGGEALLLPFSAYRAPAWNDHRPVLDPLGRYLGTDYVADDDLVVDGTTIAGEDPRVPAVRAALAQPSPTQRARALERLGIGVVAIERDAPGPAPDIAGRPLHDGPLLEVAGLPSPRTTHVAGWRLACQSAAWCGYLVGLVTGLAGGLERALRRMQRARLLPGSLRRGREKGHP